MKTGRTLVDLATELERQVKTRRDFVAPTDKLTATADVALLGLPDAGPLRFTDLAHGQIANELAIPKPYYDRMVQQAPDLWATNVNHWLRHNPQARLVRTLDGRVRSFLSDRFRPLDNYELTTAVIPAVRDLGDARIESAEVTERRLYIKIVRPSLQWDAAMAKREALLAKGGNVHTFLNETDVLQAAVTIRNSEVGDGALAIESGIYRLSCLNLATVTVAHRTAHVGRKHGNGGGNGDDAYQLLSDEARQADDKAYWLRVRDIVKHTLSAERFQATAAKFAGAVADAIEGKVEKVVEVTAVKFGLTDATREGVLRHLIEGGDLSRYGLINAVTRQSQNEKDYDLATDLERLGGKILELSTSEWKNLGSAN